MIQAVKTNNKTLNVKKTHRRKVDDIDTWLSEDSQEYKDMIEYIYSPESLARLKKIQKGKFIDEKTFFTRLYKKLGNI